jgi:hypothetical protein
MPTSYLILTILIIVILIRLLFRKVLNLPAYKGKLLSEKFVVTNILSEKKFWDIIQAASKKSKRNYRWQCQYVTEYLNNLTAEEIIQFDRTFILLMTHSYSFRLWEAVYALNGGGSDDGFEHFRTWLIGQGKNKFYWTIKYPRLLFLVGVKEIIENYEGLSYCAYEAYQNKTGLDIPQRNDNNYTPSGQIFKEGEAFLRYPELALLAW